MDYITSDQLKRVTKRSSFEASKLIVTDWLIITGTFLVTVYWSNPLTWVIAVLFWVPVSLVLASSFMKPDTAPFFHRSR